MSGEACTCGHSFRAHQEPGSGACDDFGRADMCPAVPVEFEGLTVDAAAVLGVRMGARQGDTWIDTQGGSTFTVVGREWRDVLEELEAAMFDTWMETHETIPAAAELEKPLKFPGSPTDT